MQLSFPAELSPSNKMLRPELRQCFDFKPLTIWSQTKHLGPCQTRKEVEQLHRATSLFDKVAYATVLSIGKQSPNKLGF